MTRGRAQSHNSEHDARRPGFQAGRQRLSAGAQNGRKAERCAVAGGVTTDLSATTEYASRFHNGEDNP